MSAIRRSVLASVADKYVSQAHRRRDAGGDVADPDPGRDRPLHAGEHGDPSRGQPPCFRDRDLYRAGEEPRPRRDPVGVHGHAPDLRGDHSGDQPDRRSDRELLPGAGARPSRLHRHPGVLRDPVRQPDRRPHAAGARIHDARLPERGGGRDRRGRDDRTWRDGFRPGELCVGLRGFERRHGAPRRRGSSRPLDLSSVARRREAHPVVRGDLLRRDGRQHGLRHAAAPRSRKAARGRCGRHLWPCGYGLPAARARDRVGPAIRSCCRPWPRRSGRAATSRPATFAA